MPWFWGGSSVWLERFPVTEEVAGSSPVHPAQKFNYFMAGRKRKLKSQLVDKSTVTQIKLSDSYISLLLGIFVVITLSTSILTYLKQKNTKPSQQISSSKTEEQPKQAKKTATINYTVSDGDDLKSISLKFYGTEDNYNKIIVANNIQNPDMIGVGTVLEIPDVVQEGSKEEPAQVPTKKISDLVYVVKNNESLWDIALRSYGDGYKWVEIAKANNLQNPDVLVEGTNLKIPR